MLDLLLLLSLQRELVREYLFVNVSVCCSERRLSATMLFAIDSCSIFDSSLLFPERNPQGES